MIIKNKQTQTVKQILFNIVNKTEHIAQLVTTFYFEKK